MRTGVQTDLCPKSGVVGEINSRVAEDHSNVKLTINIYMSLEGMVVDFLFVSQEKSYPV